MGNECHFGKGMEGTIYVAFRLSDYRTIFLVSVSQLLNEDCITEVIQIIERALCGLRG